MRRTLSVSLLAMSAAACGGAGKQAPSSRDVKMGPRDPVALLTPLDRSRWTPEAAPSAELVERLPDGTERSVLGRLRIETTPQGALRRSKDLLPAGRASALALPDRLGGGWAFTSTQGVSLLWRSTGFLGRLEPLARVSLGPNVVVVAGPDRLLVRGLSTDRVEGLDAETGAAIGPGALPVAPRFSALAFADARHGVAFADLRGPLFTADGGNDWRPLAVPDAQRGVALEHGRLVVQSSTGRLLIGLDGSVTPADDPDATSIGRKSSPPVLGPRPLRAALETGWPLLDGTALVARGGVLARVRLDDGEVVASAPLDGEEDATCTTIRMGSDVGLVCGGEGRGTTVRAFVPPLSTQVVARFATPRAVSPSGNGSVVVRGSCRDDEPEDSGARAYCVIGRDGDRREIATRGDVGVERVVALADGRVAVLVPPRGATDGVITLIPKRGAPTSVTMQLPPDLPALRRGLWLEGPIEIAPGEIASWVDGGGSLGGVRVHLEDGTVLAGHTHVPLAISGPVALAQVRGDRRDALVESLDGGLTWQAVEVPALEQGKLVAGGTGRDAGIHCSAAGCVLPFERGTWLRVGWGPAADPTDLEDAREPTPVRQMPMPGAPSLACEVTKIEPLGEAADPRADGRAMAIGMGPSGRRVDESIAWSAFHGAAPPVLPKGWVGFSELVSNPSQVSRLYAWAPKGATGATAARLQARLFDRFDPEVVVRSSAVSIAPWRDEQAIADALGAGGPAVVFHGLLDPHGRAAVAAGCRGAGREACDLYGVVEGRAVVPLPESDEEPYLRLFAGGSAVWMDETFYVAGGGTPGVLVVWKIEAGRARVLARLPRLGSVVGGARLVRRARSRGLGVLTTGAVGPRAANQWFVMPIDPDTGATAGMIVLGGPELGGQAARRCTADDDGWIVEGISTGASVPAARTSSAESRMRLDPGRACIESMSATLLDVGEARHPTAKSAPKKKEVTPRVRPDEGSIPLIAIGAGRRLVAACRQ